MNKPSHQFNDLFAQLGLPADAAGIARFLQDHAPLPGDIRLADAPFWSGTQAAFLRESLQQDADWSGPVDQLSEALRAGKIPA